tara:strand:+ start:39209 stop:40141 length:933 start_codon:yes stop_codon:yes gene_type:complete
MKKLLVASIYTPTSKVNGWFDTQRKFLDLTTEDYDFGVFCNMLTKPEDFPGAIIVGQQTHEELKKHFTNGDYQPDDEELGLASSKYHYDIRVAYFKVMEYFKEHADEYENFLLIDSDIFPVHPHWQTMLTKRMEMTNRWYAALLRAETFETYPWLGLFYIRGQYIHEDIADWFPREYQNSWGRTMREFGTCRNKTHQDGSSIWYPLLRSNVINLHPVRFGIYNHFFYHHMKGSWDKNDPNFHSEFTVNSVPELYGYYDHYMSRESHAMIAEHCHKRLLAEPESFICQLMGVDPNEWFNQENINVERSESG